ncbi:MAG: DUF1848 domain-containing protein [Clostridiales bacterium]|nr:DUF1848 domain-containing protein [Clostridiales bacterium]
MHFLAIGSSPVIWRYDPIITSHEFNIDYHLEHFSYLASRFHKRT